MAEQAATNLYYPMTPMVRLYYLQATLFPSHTATPRERVVEAEKRCGVDHRKIERQHEDFRAERPDRPERRQKIEDELRTEDREIQRGVQQEKVRDQSH